VSDTEDDLVATGILPVFQRQATLRSARGCPTDMGPGSMCIQLAWGHGPAPRGSPYRGY